jgi:hypothetical protein
VAHVNPKSSQEFCHYEYIIWDPRGWDKTSSIPMPSSFCPHCCFPPLKCHVQLFVFGQYYQLHIVNDLYQTDDPINSIQAKELYTERYNIAFQMKTVKEMRQLEIKLNGNDLPRCVVEQSLSESMDYVNWYRYYVKMHSDRVVGQVRSSMVMVKFDFLQSNRLYCEVLKKFIKKMVSSTTEARRKQKN